MSGVSIAVEQKLLLLLLQVMGEVLVTWRVILDPQLGSIVSRLPDLWTWRVYNVRSL